MGKKCITCGEAVEFEFSDFCASCFKLDPDKLMEKFLEREGEEGISNRPSKLGFWAKLRTVWGVLIS